MILLVFAKFRTLNPVARRAIRSSASLSVLQLAMALTRERTLIVPPRFAYTEPQTAREIDHVADTVGFEG